MKKCMSCGSEMTDSASFCAMCGGNTFQALESNTATSQSVVAPAGTSSSSQVTSQVIIPAGNVQTQVVSPKMKKVCGPVSGGTKFGSGVIVFVLSLIMILLSSMFIIRFSLSEGAINSVAKNLEGKIADIEVGFLDRSMDDDVTLSEFVFERTMRARMQNSSYVNMNINDDVQESIEDILNEPFLSQFLADTFSDYVEFILYDRGRGYLKVTDITELIEDNQKKIEKLSDNHVSTKFITMVEEAVTESGVLEELDMREVEKDNRGLFGTIRLLFSGVIEVSFILIALLLVAILFVIRRDRYKACTLTGSAFIITGAFDLLLVGGTVIGAIMANNEYPFGIEIYNGILSPLRLYSGISVACFLVVGIIFVVIGKLLKRNYQ